VPKLWDDSIETHRRAVREAIMDAAWRLAEEHGPLSLTMSEIAQAAAIGRATLYKYFADVESILVAHHAQHVEKHLEELQRLGAEPGDAVSRLVNLVQGYAMICFHRGRHSSTELAALVHRGPELVDVERRLHELFVAALEEARADGLTRQDTSADELAYFCLHALPAAGQSADGEQVSRLVRVVLDGLGCAAAGAVVGTAAAHRRRH
jgi:AcrR family transcriptional regulator